MATMTNVNISFSLFCFFSALTAKVLIFVLRREVSSLFVDSVVLVDIFLDVLTRGVVYAIVI